MQTILNASQQIIAPFSQANVIVTLSEVSTDASGAATITWSDSLNGTPRPVGQAVTLPASLAGQREHFPDSRRSFLCLYAQSRLRDHRHRQYCGQLFAVSAKLDVYHTHGKPFDNNFLSLRRGWSGVLQSAVLKFGNCRLC